MQTRSSSSNTDTGENENDWAKRALDKQNKAEALSNVKKALEKVEAKIVSIGNVKEKFNTCALMQRTNKFKVTIGDVFNLEGWAKGLMEKELWLETVMEEYNLEISEEEETAEEEDANHWLYNPFPEKLWNQAGNGEIKQFLFKIILDLSPSDWYLGKDGDSVLDVIQLAKFKVEKEVVKGKQKKELHDFTKKFVGKKNNQLIKQYGEKEALDTVSEIERLCQKLKELGFTKIQLNSMMKIENHTHHGPKANTATGMITKPVWQTQRRGRGGGRGRWGGRGGGGRTGSARFQPQKCFNCGGAGHMAKFCSQERRWTKCKVCGSEEHKTVGCPEATCFACGEKGHMQMICTLVTLEGKTDRIQSDEKHPEVNTCQGSCPNMKKSMAVFGENSYSQVVKGDIRVESADVENEKLVRLLEVEVEVEGITTAKALLDTGANVSFVSEEFLSRINRSSLVERIPVEKIKVKSMVSTWVTSGMVKLRVELAGNCVTVELYVAEYLPCDLLLGTYDLFVKENGFKVTIQAGTEAKVVVKSKKGQQVVELKSDLTHDENHWVNVINRVDERIRTTSKHASIPEVLDNVFREFKGQVEPIMVNLNPTGESRFNDENRGTNDPDEWKHEMET